MRLNNIPPTRLPIHPATVLSGYFIFKPIPYPITEATTENLGTQHHSRFAIADVNGKPVRLVVAHPLAPVSIDNFGHRHEAMAALVAYAVQQPITMVIMGDFNLTSRSLYFRDFIR